MDENGESPKLEDLISSTASPSARNALAAIYEALKAQVMVKNMANRLNGMFDGGEADLESDSAASKGSFKFTVGPDGKVNLTMSGVPSVGANNGLSKAAGKIGIQNWSSERPVGGNVSYTIGGILSGNPSGAAGHRNDKVLVKSGGEVRYAPIGSLTAGGGGTNVVEVDNASIATNGSGKLEMRGFEEMAAENDIPVVIGDSISWRTLDTAVFDIGNGGNFNVSLKGYSPDLGPKKYLGTGKDGDWGVHDLPDAGSDIADGHSIVTNANGKIEISGFLEASRKAQNGLVPTTVIRDMKTFIEWKEQSEGSAIKFVGTDGGEGVVGSGAVTNTVTFASATNSAVTVSVTQPSAGNVTITIGVYYK